MPSKSNLLPLLISVSFVLYSCSGVGSFRKRDEQATKLQQSSADSLPIDPWSLGPDVFTELELKIENLDTIAEIQPQVQVDTAPLTELEVQTTESSVRVEPETLVMAQPPVVSIPLEPKPLARPPAIESQAVPAATKPVIETGQLDTYYTIQVGTFLDRTKATDFAARAATALGLPGIVQFENPFYRLRFGELATRVQADSLHRVAMSRGFYDARVVKLSNP